jgi:hypothetical protein
LIHVDLVRELRCDRCVCFVCIVRQLFGWILQCKYGNAGFGVLMQVIATRCDSCAEWICST